MKVKVSIPINEYCVEKTTENFSLENIVKGIWSELCKVTCNSYLSNTNLPTINYNNGFCLSERGCLGLTTMSQNPTGSAHIEMFLQNKNKIKLLVLIHELIHARGFRHNPLIGFVTTITNDRFSEKIALQMGLMPNTELIFEVVESNIDSVESKTLQKLFKSE